MDYLRCVMPWAASYSRNTEDDLIVGDMIRACEQGRESEFMELMKEKKRFTLVNLLDIFGAICRSDSQSVFEYMLEFVLEHAEEPRAPRKGDPKATFWVRISCLCARWDAVSCLETLFLMVPDLDRCPCFDTALISGATRICGAFSSEIAQFIDTHQDASGVSPIVGAIVNRQTHVILHFAPKCAFPRRANFYSVGLIHVLAAYGNPESVAAMLKHHPELMESASIRAPQIGDPCKRPEKFAFEDDKKYEAFYSKPRTAFEMAGDLNGDNLVDEILNASQDGNLEEVIGRFM